MFLLLFTFFLLLLSLLMNLNVSSFLFGFKLMMSNVQFENVKVNGEQTVCVCVVINLSPRWN